MRASISGGFILSIALLLTGAGASAYGRACEAELSQLNGIVDIHSLDYYNSNIQNAKVVNGRLWLFGYATAWQEWYGFPEQTTFFVRNGHLYLEGGERVIGIDIAHRIKVVRE